MLMLEGRRAVVCGSTQGIGRACAIALAEAGCAVCLLARHAEALEQVRGEMATPCGQVHGARQADFADPGEVGAAVEAEVRERGPVHVLVHNTGGPPAGTAIEAEPEAFVKAFTQHLVCGQHLVQALVPGMVDAGFGRIVNIISTSVVAPIRGLGVSNTIRGAVANWGRTLAAELGGHGITVNNVLPGYTDTARLRSLLQGRANRAGTSLDEVVAGIVASIPAKRFAGPEEVAAVVAFLCSPAASYVNGVNLPVDGGRTAAQ